MRTAVFLVTLLSVVMPLVWGIAPLYHAQEKFAEDSYIVVLKDDVDVDAISSSLSSIAAVSEVGFEVTKTFRTVLNGFAVTVRSKDMLALIQSHYAVRYVEEDGIAYADDVTWGIDRTDQRNLPLDNSYTPYGTGEGAHVYIVDTGLRTTHVEFNGRATFAYDATGIAEGAGGDCNGHGTHCAGTAAGSDYGVASKASVYGVRVLGCEGSGAWSWIIGGMDWVAQNGSRPAVASMSLSGPATGTAVDEAVARLVGSGVVLTVSAGNNDYDACQRVPARSLEAITVGATEDDDSRAYFSNYGGCVNIFAPGRYIVSAGINSDTEYTSKSGTSMSTPHVAGAAAVHLAEYPGLTPADIRGILYNDATRGKVTDPKDSPNLLLYVPEA